MLDIQMLKDNPQAVADALATRGFHFDVPSFLLLEQSRKSLQSKTQALQNERNVRSKSIGEAKARGEPIEPLREAMNQLAQELAAAKTESDAVLAEIEALLSRLPNIPHPETPKGKDESDNLEISRFGKIPVFDFTPKSHDELGEALGLMDFSAAAKLTGARFVLMKGALARLQRALIAFMLDLHTIEHAYEELYVPYIVNADSLYGTGQLPKFAEDLFKIEGDLPYYLIPTAEIPVTNLARDTIATEDELPKRYVCHSPCFRSEAGSYGRDTKGLIRQHQFEKVELVWICKAEDSYKALEQLTGHAETVLQRLDLAYRKIALCTADLGPSAAKTYDLEVWLPSQNTYREISSCSNMEAFQARRMKARYRDKQGAIHLLHSLNGSGLAVGRTLVAVMEQYQDKEGNIHIPQALRPYLGGLERIGSRAQ